MGIYRSIQIGVALLAVLSTTLSGIRYGWEGGMYFWFSNLALMGSAHGFLMRDAGVLIAVLSLGCFTQIFWVLDEWTFLTTGLNRLGLIDYLLQPGLPLSEFILNHHFHFSLLIALYGLLKLPRKKTRSLLYILILNPLLYALSYFLFPSDLNINCAHESCLSPLNFLSGPLYTLTFGAVVLALHIVVGMGLEKVFSRRIPKNHERKIMLLIYVFTGLGFLATGWGIVRKAQLPHLSCVAKEESPIAKVKCRYTVDYDAGQLLLVYEMRNKTRFPTLCKSSFEVNGQIQTLNELIVLEPHEVKKLDAIFDYPQKDTVIYLKASCDDLSPAF